MTYIFTFSFEKLGDKNDLISILHFLLSQL